MATIQMPSFSDEKWYSAKDKEKIFKNFVTSVEKRSLENMTELAYNYYHGHCGFIAHYSKSGFQQEYADSRFLVFLNAFVDVPWYLRANQMDLHKALCEIARQHIDKVVQETKNRLLNREIEQLKALAYRLGYKVVPKDVFDDESEESVLFNVEDNGQLRLIS
ncbi:hypothetical protein [Alicyclobacillus fodiniaquatilis]|uniref:Uncharacterized protein n=1 Tax=Alicyclobacillus fodiniaquatilis TaxID=1661150 RepID=A0ABW4JIR8_9BACL